MGNFDSFPRTNALNVSENRFNHESGYQNEKLLFDLHLTELYNQHGVPMDFYITTYDTQYDLIFGEDNNRRFVRKFEVSPWYTLPREDRLWNRFGIEGIDEIVMYVSKRAFKCNSMRAMGPGAVEYIPRVGDILVAKYNKYIYEVVNVRDESALYLQSKQHVWELNVKPYKDAHIMTAGTALSADFIADYSNKTTDLFDIKNEIDTAKEPILYQPKPCEKPKNDPFGGW
jgi:hypothetical protein